VSFQRLHQIELTDIGARNTSAPSLMELSQKYPGRVEIVRLSSGVEGDAAAAASLIAEKVGKLDVVFANAGWSKIR
jgi:NAD(P)-dependent dehydrogenase (short-subunit alcohol dehydrogenase family)